MPVNRDDVKFIAGLISSDPNEVLSEAPYYGRRGEPVHSGGGRGSRTMQDLELDRPGHEDAVGADADVDYDVNVSGRYIPATYYEPEEHPSVEVTNPRVSKIVLYDQNGQPMEPDSPEEFAHLAKQVIMYFEKQISKIENEEHENLVDPREMDADREYDSRFDR